MIMVINKNVMKRCVYFISFYIIYLISSEISTSYNLSIRLPISKYTFYLDSVLFLAGGVIFGITLIEIGNTRDRIWGFVMISLNILVVPYLFLRMIV